MPAPVKFTCAGRTDVGIIRTGNEDNYLMIPDRGVFIVADGMGGHAAGEVASEMAVRIVARELGDLTGVGDAEMGERVRKAIREAFGFDADPSVTPAQNEKFGDYQANVAMGLARQLSQQTGQKTSPRVSSSPLPFDPSISS